MDDATVPGSSQVIIDDDGEIVVVGVGLISKTKHGPLAATERILAASDIETFAVAVRNPDRYHAELPAEIQIVLGSDDYDPYLYDSDDILIVVDETRVCGVFEVVVLSGRRLPDRDYLRLLDPPLAPLGCRVDELEFVIGDGTTEAEADWIDWNDPAERSATLAEPRLLRVHIVGDTLAHLIQGARQSRALLAAVADRPLDAPAAAHLVRTGMLEAVVGLRESDWLEVKSGGYQLSAPDRAAAARQKLELAQDVARFANSDFAAVLLIGYQTANPSTDGEVIDKVTPVKLVHTDAEQHRKVIDAHVYPTVEGLRIDRVAVGDDRAVLVIEVPQQPDYLKPFLVHGAVVGGRVDGTFISIVRRRDSHSIVTDPSQIHAQLAAGRALLRGGNGRPDPSPSGAPS